MKHQVNVTFVIITIFFLTQVFGNYLLTTDMAITIQDDQILVNHSDTILGPRPDTQGFGSFAYIAFAIAIGTFLVLMIMKFGKMRLWKIWFFFAVFFSISISLGVIITSTFAFIIAFILALLKLFRPNIITHNLSEILMYSGLAVLIAPLFDLFWAFMLLIAISIYDMYAVWKSKHMVEMAKFQTKSKMFAGLMIPYKEKKGITLEIPDKNKQNTKKVKNAILGGGDVAFPLIFTGVVIEHLVTNGLTKFQAFMQANIISVFVTIALLGLFVYAKKDKFYPAMPFVSAGCFLGYLVIIFI